MKIFKYALLAIPFLYFSCDDDNDTPEPEPVTMGSKCFGTFPKLSKVCYSKQP